MVAFKVKNLLFVIFVVLFCSPTSLLIKVVSMEGDSPSLCPVLTLAYSVAFKQFLLNSFGPWCFKESIQTVQATFSF